MNLSQKMILLMRQTENPMAPTILGSARGSITALGKLMASIANKSEVDSLTARFADEIPNPYSAETVMFLCSCLVASLEGFVARLGEEEHPREETHQ